jgi:flagellar biogenesis protein FliO
MSTAPPVEQLSPSPLETQPLQDIRAWRQPLLIKAWGALRWIMQRVKVQPTRKNLRICENISLGEKRFVAVVQVDQERFLIGGSSSSVSLLTRLQETKTFAATLDQEAAKIS